MRATKSQFASLLLLVLASCQAQHSWKVQRGLSSTKEYEASKLVQSSAYLDLEFMRIGSTVECFLIVKASPIPSMARNKQETLLKIETTSGSFSVPLIRHAGGQKFSFTKEAKEILFHCLDEKQPFQLTLQSYTMTIDTEGFEDSYKQFCKKPFMENPFRLSF
jgi:hypothetical protein